MTNCSDSPCFLEPSLRELGPRICVIGPSNSGKSTLAVAMGKVLELPVIHLDQMSHVAGTDWVRRPQTEFVALHDAAIQSDRWIMEGNYSICLPQRLQRATGFILLDVSTPVSLWRYIRRERRKAHRAGGLAGAAKRIRWSMIKHIIGATRHNRRAYRIRYAEIPLPKRFLPSSRAVRNFYDTRKM